LLAHTKGLEEALRFRETRKRSRAIPNF